MEQGEKADNREYARVIHKLAEVCWLKGDVERNARLRDEAETIYEQLIGTGQCARLGNDREKWDYLVCLKFR